jgi:predicted transcriptional regulator
MLEQRQLAKEAGISAATIVRMEKSGLATARSHARNVEAVLKALERHGVKVTETGVEKIAVTKP